MRTKITAPMNALNDIGERYPDVAQPELTRRSEKSVSPITAPTSPTPTLPQRPNPRRPLSTTPAKVPARTPVMTPEMTWLRVDAHLVLLSAAVLNL